MIMKKPLMRIYVAGIFVLAVLLSTIARAEKKEVFPGPDGSEYEVHYIGFASTFIDEEVAKQYKIVRSRSLGLVNISIIKIDKDGKRKAVGGAVQAEMINDIRQSKFLSFQQIVEGDAIYYLAQLQYREGELLTFDVTVYPEGGTQPLKLRFTQHFYND
jgi:hypothetical protein